MCICFFQVNPPGSNYPLIFCGNRDEFYSRDSLALHRWKDADGVYGGRDSVRGGTWLGMKPATSEVDVKWRFAVVHNFRHSDAVDQTKVSRGELPTNFLKGHWTAKEYAEKVEKEGSKYMGFTLIVADETGVYFTSNRGPHRKLEPGIYSLSNALLDTPWPKSCHGKEIFKHVLEKHTPTRIHDHEQEDDLLYHLCHKVLRDNTIFAKDLPGIHDVHTETLLSSVFVEPYKWKDWGFYGTRMQTLCVVRKDGSMRVQEYSLDTATSAKDWRGEWSKVQYELGHHRSTL